MIQDAQLALSTNQVVTVTADSTNVIDLGAAKRGDGQPLAIQAAITADFATGDSITAALHHGDDATTMTAVMTGSTVLTANAKTGTKLLSGYLPTGLKRYVKVIYTVAGSAMTTGKVSASILNELPTV